MPKAFSEEERGRARAAIVAAARAEFLSRGYRKANVATIASEAGVGKGTIYLFFVSKAELFVEVLEQVEREVRSELIATLDRDFEDPRARLEHFFRAILGGMIDHPLLWIVVDPAEATALFADLDAEAELLARADDEFFASLIAHWRAQGWIGPVAPEVFAGAGRALYAVALHRDLIGAAYPQVIDLFVRSLAETLCSERGTFQVTGEVSHDAD